MKKGTTRKAAKVCALLAFALVAVAATSLWNKSDFCRGWSGHYGARAAANRDRLTRVLVGNRNVDAVDLESSVLTDLLIAEKYNRVATNPFLPYPKRPLVTAHELESFRDSQSN